MPCTASRLRADFNLPQTTRTRLVCVIVARSYWIPGSYAPALPEKHDAFFRLLKTEGFKEESMTQVGLYAIGTSTTLESNKSLSGIAFAPGAIEPF